MRIFSSLTNRIFLATAWLAILCTATAIYLVNDRVTASAEDELRRALEQTGKIVDQQRATVSDLFTVLARFVDQLSNLKAAVATDHPPTVQPIAAEYQRQVGADLLLVTNRNGDVLANLAPGRLVDPAFPSLPTVREALKGRETAMFWRRRDGVAQVVSVPITVGAPPPEILGTFTLGFLLDDKLAATFKALTTSEIAFATGGRVVASTFPPRLRPALEPLLSSPGQASIAVGGEQYFALLRPLVSPRNASLFGGLPAAPAIDKPNAEDASVPIAIILQSRTERLRFLRPIQTALIGTGILAVLLAIALSYGIARTIARPLREITAAMREMAATGDLTRKIQWRNRNWQDEDAALLARTFNTLTDSVARFQREAAERERLSALGRLSTVVAHEVRNPLMIIKASLQPLMRGTPSPEAISEAAQDISEEVTRLNRLVNEVLDYARPLRYELAATDINKMCEESVAAASADPSSAGIRVELDRSLPPVVTDSERLRAALVNILVNARHAVTARTAAQPVPTAAGPAGTSADVRDDQPAVALQTVALPGDRYAIIVRDRGVGIAAADLPKVFEPYFTTKRAGTGLGLAISRNIIDGLGGRIQISSQPGVGTEVRIELPRKASQESA